MRTFFHNVVRTGKDDWFLLLLINLLIGFPALMVLCVLLICICISQSSYQLEVMIAPFSDATASVEMSLFSFLFATMGISVHSCNGCVCELIYLALIEEFAYLVYSRLVVIWYIMVIFVVLFTGFIKYWTLLEALYSSWSLSCSAVPLRDFFNK